MIKTQWYLKPLTLISFFILIHSVNAQSTEQVSMLPYHQIPEYPENYTPETVAARMVDGLGYRYYWATEGLTENDLQYKPSEDARTTRETLEHIYGLTNIILKAPLKEINSQPEVAGLSFDELREKTLLNIQRASTLLKNAKPKEIESYKIIFKNGKSQSEYPYWNMLNGPIADALYHVGQVVSFRRSSGNPMNDKVNVFLGKTRE